MEKTVKFQTYSELAVFIADAMSDGYEFEEMDGTLEDGGSIVLDKKDNEDDEIVIICEDGTNADICYNELLNQMQKASSVVLKSFIYPFMYLS